MPKYHLTIEETVTGKRLTPRKWLVVGEDENGKNVYDYVPQVEEIGENTETVFEIRFAGENGCLMRIAEAILASIRDDEKRAIAEYRDRVLQKFKEQP